MAVKEEAINLMSFTAALKIHGMKEESLILVDEIVSITLH